MIAGAVTTIRTAILILILVLSHAKSAIAAPQCDKDPAFSSTELIALIASRGKTTEGFLGLNLDQALSSFYQDDHVTKLDRNRILERLVMESDKHCQCHLDALRKEAASRVPSLNPLFYRLVPRKLAVESIMVEKQLVDLYFSLESCNLSLPHLGVFLGCIRYFKDVKPRQMNDVSQGCKEIIKKLGCNSTTWSEIILVLAISGVRAQRADLQYEFTRRYQESIRSYSIEAAIADVLDYHAACGLWEGQLKVGEVVDRELLRANDALTDKTDDITLSEIAALVDVLQAERVEYNHEPRRSQLIQWLKKRQLEAPFGSTLRNLFTDMLKLMESRLDN